MAEVEIVAYGVPKTQGSKTGYAFKRKDGTLGTRLVESVKGLKEWRQTVRAAGIEAMKGKRMLRGPLLLDAIFYMPRPKAHYVSNDPTRELKANAPTYHISLGDLEKLERAIKDAVEGVVYRNDSIVAKHMCSKVYSASPRVRFLLLELEDS